MLSTILVIVQMVVAGFLIASILLQQKGSGLGSAFGGTGGVYTTRRGIDRVLFNITIALSIVFFAIALLTLVF